MNCLDYVGEIDLFLSFIFSQRIYLENVKCPSSPIIEEIKKIHRDSIHLELQELCLGLFCFHLLGYPWLL